MRPTQNPLFNDVGERHRFQEDLDLAAEFFPQIMGETAAGVRKAAFRAAIPAAGDFDGFFDGADDIGNPGFCGRVGKPITAPWTARRDHKSAATQLGKELLQVSERNLLTLGDFAKRD